MKIFVIFIVLLNIALLISNMLLVKSLNSVRSQEKVTAAKLSETVNKLAFEKARVANKERLVVKLSSQIEEQKQKVSIEPEKIKKEEDPIYEHLTTRPDLNKIPLLTPEEMEFLYKKSSAMPKKLGNIVTRALFEAIDIGTILEDPVWNPNGRQLDQRERLQLSKLLKDYRFFGRISSAERYKNFIKPEVGHMREFGAFIEYPANEPPPHIDGVRITHAEPSDKPGWKRLYVFDEADYPELLRQRQVERQRGLESLINMYELINGPVLEQDE